MSIVAYALVALDSVVVDVDGCSFTDSAVIGEVCNTRLAGVGLAERWTLRVSCLHVHVVLHSTHNPTSLGYRSSLLLLPCT